MTDVPRIADPLDAGEDRSSPPVPDAADRLFLDQLVEKAIQGEPYSEKEAVDAVERLVARGESASAPLRQVWEKGYYQSVLTRALDTLGTQPGTGREFLSDVIRNGSYYPYYRAYAARLLGKVDAQQGHALLTKVLVTVPRDGVSDIVDALYESPLRGAALQSQEEAERYWQAYLGSISTEDVATRIIDILADKTAHVAAPAEGAQAPPGSPAIKLAALLDVVSRTQWVTRDDLIDADLRRAVDAPDTERDALARTVVNTLARWGPHEPRLIELAAGVLCVLYSGSRPAGRTLEEIGVSELDLSLEHKLRAEIGGAAALQPVFDQFESEIKAKLDKVAKLATKDWESATRSAKVAFNASMVVSLVVVLLGAAAAITAIFQVLSGESTQTTLGEGISLAAGLAAMITPFFAGPLKNMRRSLHDRGAAHIAFATYIHRLHFSGAFFAAEQARGRMTFELLKETGESLDAAAESAVQVLMTTDGSRRRPDSSGANGAGSPNPPATTTAEGRRNDGESTGVVVDGGVTPTAP